LFLPFFLSIFLRFTFTFIITVTSGNARALIGPWPRIGNPAVHVTIHGTFLYFKAFFIPKNPNVYIILSSRKEKTQTLFRKFAGMVNTNTRSRNFSG
jgi:hypothetical protein